MEKDIQIPINIYNDEEDDDRSNSIEKGMWQCFQLFVERVSIMLGAWGFMLLFDEEWHSCVGGCLKNSRNKKHRNK